MSYYSLLFYFDEYSLSAMYFQIVFYPLFDFYTPNSVDQRITRHQMTKPVKRNQGRENERRQRIMI